MERYQEIEKMIQQTQDVGMKMLLNQNTVSVNMAQNKNFLKEHEIIDLPVKGSDGKIERRLAIFLKQGPIEACDIDADIIYHNKVYDKEYVVIPKESPIGQTLVDELDRQKNRFKSKGTAAEKEEE